MNPIHWNKNHQAALAIAVIIGIVAGVIVGYIVYAISRGAGGAMNFGLWLEYPLRHRVFWWAIVGGIIGAAMLYVKHLLKDGD